MSGAQREGPDLIIWRALEDNPGLGTVGEGQLSTAGRSLKSSLAAELFAIPNIAFCSVISVLALAGLLLARAYQIKPQAITASALVLFSYPLIYYVTHPGVEYRHAIDPVLTVFIGTLGSALAIRRTDQSALAQPE